MINFFKLTKKSYYNFFLLTLIIATSGCLRFTPSRESLSDGDSAAKYAGEEAFYNLDKVQAERLEKITTQRSLEKPITALGTYRIGVNDILELNVFDAAEMNRKIRVRPDGTISLPLVGNIRMVGLTEEEAQAEITKRLTEFMHSPQVQLFISEYAAHKVWVVGEIYKPGAYPLSRDNYSLIELLSEAGGRKEKASSLIILIPNSKTDIGTENEQELTQIAGESNIAPKIDSNINPNTNPTITPNLALSDPNKYGIEIPYESLIGSPNKPPLHVPLHAGDTIVVPEAGTVQVDGDVVSPGSYPLPSKITLMGAIASAGGLRYSADVERIEIIREISGGKKALVTVNLEKIAIQDGDDIRLRNGDIVRVPSDSSRFFTNQTITVLNGLLGRVPVPGN